MAEINELPDKPFYKAGEVCKYTDTQPYVLTFWESEFPQLAPEKSRGGQAMYTRADIETVLRIKALLYEEEQTIADARERLDAEQSERGKKSGGASASSAAPAASAGRGKAAGADADHETRMGADQVPRGRYEDALDEIAHLRLQLKEAETQVRRAHSAQAKADELATKHRGRSDKAVATLERLLEIL